MKLPIKKGQIRFGSVALVLLCTILMGMGSLMGVLSQSLWQAVLGDDVLAFFFVGMSLPIKKCKEPVTEKSGEIEWL
jgi:hypothetical protein